MSLEKAWTNYTGSCSCGIAFENNCAHYLGQALIKGGFSQLDGGSGAEFRIVDGRCVCKTGRPVRAKELRTWFSSVGIKHDVQPENEYCLVYQERLSDGQGHVLLKKWNDYKGTGNFPSWNVQEFYTL